MIYKGINLFLSGVIILSVFSMLSMRRTVRGYRINSMEGDLIDFRDTTDNSGTGTSHQPATTIETDVGTPNLGDVFKQCKLAREKSISANFTVFGPDVNCSFGTGNPPRIGNIEMPGDTEVLHTFHGARMSKGMKIVNECISMSFDPRNYMCVGCKEPHRLGSKGPVVICFSDQNFVPLINDSEGGCIAICRMDNTSLSKLVDFSFEVLENFPLVPGSIILYGSASYLFRAGVSVYAREWVDCNTKVGAKWRNIHTCPLIPIVRENCPGSMARDIEQLAAWLLKVYSNNINGLSDCWKAVMAATRSHSQEGSAVGQGEHYKLLLPSS
jgi:hypothetical protein